MIYCLTMNTILDFITTLAKQAGKILLSYYNKSSINIKLKSDNTIVTEADFIADRLIQTSIRENFPEDGILSEEGTTIYPSDKNYVWVIDPLDGTTNFSLGLHYWGISIARLCNGYPDLAVLYFPVFDELLTAIKGEGATLNGRRLSVELPDQDNPTKFFSCCSRTNKTYRVDNNYKTRILGSAAYGLIMVAKGSAILAFEATPKIWDFSGSWLITQESGGTIAPLREETPFPLVQGVDYGKRSHPILVAPTQKEWDSASREIRTR